MSDLIEELRGGTVWFLSESAINEAETDALMHRAADEIERLQSLSDQNRLTGGWRAVPEEPTMEMIAAGGRCGNALCGSDKSPDDIERAVWKAMLAASPPLPLPGGEEKR